MVYDMEYTHNSPEEISKKRSFLFSNVNYSYFGIITNPNPTTYGCRLLNPTACLLLGMVKNEPCRRFLHVSCPNSKIFLLVIVDRW